MEEEGNGGMLYHEMQEGLLCGLHCLNTALQGPFFTEEELLLIALDLDERERRVLFHDQGTERGRESHNISYNGNFSCQVLERALQKWDLEFISIYSQAAGACRSSPELETAFICNFGSHWYSIRNVDGEWYNFNSLYPAPENLPRSTLAPYLHNLRASGVHIYAVRGTFPTKCPNDYNDFGQWLSPDEASNITRSRYQPQKKQQSNSAIEMASRHYRMVAIAASLRGVQVEVQSEQPHKQEGVSMKQEKNAADLELAIAISLMPFEAPVASCHPAQGEICNMEHDSSKCEDSTKQD